MLPNPMVYAVRLPAILTPDSLDSYVVIGVRCPHCEVAYSLALPRSRTRDEGVATRWAQENLGECGSHPAVLYEVEDMLRNPK